MGVARAECPCVVKLRPGFGDDAAAEPALACVAGGGCRDGLWLTGGLALSANPAGCGNTGAPHFMAHLRTACAFRCVTPNALQHSCT